MSFSSRVRKNPGFCVMCVWFFFSLWKSGERWSQTGGRTRSWWRATASFWPTRLRWDVPQALHQTWREWTAAFFKNRITRHATENIALFFSVLLIILSPFEAKIGTQVGRSQRTVAVLMMIVILNISLVLMLLQKMRSLYKIQKVSFNFNDVAVQKETLGHVE